MRDLACRSFFSELDSLKVIIADRDFESASQLKTLLSQEMNQVEVVGVTQSFSGLKRILKNWPEVDCIFLGHSLKSTNLSTAVEIDEIQYPTVFIMAADNQTNDLPPNMGLLSYPFDKLQVQAILEKLNHYKLNGRLLSEIEELKQLIVTSRKPYKERLVIRMGQRLMYKGLEEVSYFFAEGKMVYLVDAADNRKYVIDYTLEELEKMLDPAKFFRISRKFIANIDFISEVRGIKSKRMELKMASGAHHELTVSRERISDLMHWLNQ